MRNPITHRLKHGGPSPSVPRTNGPGEHGEPIWHDAVTALWLMLAGSIVEILALQLEKRSQPMLRVSRDFVWMAPAALAAVVLVAVAACLLVGFLVPRHIGRALIVFVSSSLVLLDLLMLIPGLSHYAALALAVGASVQWTRFALRHATGVWSAVRRSAPVLFVCFAVISVGIWYSWSRPPDLTETPAIARPASGPPNVLLITLDAVRASSLSLYGYPRQTSPNLERFARRGVVFENAFAAAPWTLPSHASLFTGRWAHELSADYTSPLDGTFPTLAEYLTAHGYATAGFAANLGYCSYQTGLGRGFRHYEDYPRSLGQVASNSTLVRKIADNFNLRRIIANDEHLNRVTASALNERALAWLSNNGDAPFFVFMNYFDAHEPYLPPPPFDRRFGPGRQRGRYSPLRRWLWEPGVDHAAMRPDELREEIDAYDGALAFLDDEVGRLLSELDRRNLLDRTLVVITADHGEEFGEHDVFEHGYSLYRPGLQVPLVVAFPGVVPRDARVPVPVTLRDVAVTIVDAIGLGAGAPFPGHSLASGWQASTEDRGPTALLSEVSRSSGQPDWFPSSKGDMKTLMYGDIKYIRNGDGTEELYDVQTDPGERHNLAPLPDRSTAIVDFRQMLARMISGEDPKPAHAPPVDRSSAAGAAIK